MLFVNTFYNKFFDLFREVVTVNIITTRDKTFFYDCPIYEDLRKKYHSILICNSSDNILKENHC